jgi:dihydrofolate reductase
MKTTLYMAISLDWYISDRDDKTPWSEEEWDNYKEAVSKVKNIAIWYETYKIMLDSSDFEEINNPKTFVFTSKDLENTWNFIFIKDYEEFKEQAKLHNIDEILICWGGKLNSYFLERNLVDEIYLDVEPFIFWSWLKLFDNISNNKDIELIDSKKYWNNWIQLHYKVK